MEQTHEILDAVKAVNFEIKMIAIKKQEEGGNPPLVSTALDFNLWNIGTIMTGRKKNETPKSFYVNSEKNNHFFKRVKWRCWKKWEVF